jgi:hypothetical protein
MAEEGIPGLIDDVEDLNLPQGTERSLLAKLGSAQRALDRGNETAATGKLTAFINQTEALKRTGRLDPASANQLIAEARAIIRDINSP